MKRPVLALSMLLGGTIAHGEPSPFYPLFTHSAHPRDKEAEACIARVVTACDFSEMSRMGPSERERKRCEVAVRHTKALGPRAAWAAIDRIDDPETPPTTTWHLYNVIGQSGDLKLVEPLVRALELEEQKGIGNERRPERAALVAALSTLTYAAPKGTPAIQWRIWADAHKDRTRAELFDERATEVEATLVTGSLDERTDAAVFLASQPATKARGKKILTQLLAEPMTPQQRNLVLFKAEPYVEVQHEDDFIEIAPPKIVTIKSRS